VIADSEPRAVAEEQSLFLLYKLQMVLLETSLSQRLVCRAQSVCIATAVVELDGENNLRLTASFPHDAGVHWR
jgi:hypothetical protein